MCTNSPGFTYTGDASCIIASAGCVPAAAALRNDCPHTASLRGHFVVAASAVARLTAVDQAPRNHCNVTAALGAAVATVDTCILVI